MKPEGSYILERAGAPGQRGRAGAPGGLESVPQLAIGCWMSQWPHQTLTQTVTDRDRSRTYYLLHAYSNIPIEGRSAIPTDMGQLWEYELYGGAKFQLQLAPHRTPPRNVCVRKIPHAPERGVGRPPRADPPPSKHEV
eukprot:scaffold1487_cov116-Isochrysis_galbana.AAC.5